MNLLTNKNAFKLIWILMIGVCCLTKAAAQTYPVTSIVNLNAGTLPYLEDFIQQNPTQISNTLILNDDDYLSIDVSLRMRIFGEGINIFTDPDYLGSMISLSFNVPKTLTGYDLVEYFNPDHLVFQGITKEQFLQGGKMPEGLYNICFEAVDPFRFDENAVSNLSCAPALLEVHTPPTLVSLIGEQNFMISPNYYFDWMDNHVGFPANYNLLIYEKGEGMTDDEVLDFIPPIVIELDNNKDQYLYSAIDPYLFPNQKYLVRVQAFDPRGQETFENNGFSNVEEFYLLDGCFSDEDDDGVCDDKDQCPWEDDTIDLNANGIPDCIEDETACVLGESCDDGIVCTTGDIIIDADCTCQGTPLPDSDADGVCDLEDQCPGFDDMEDTDGDGTPDCLTSDPSICVVGALCDDGDPCTYYDIIVDSDCNCLGTATRDSDNDGFCDLIDQCPGQDDSIDLNNNGIADCFEANCLVGDPCDDGDPCTYFDVILNSNCDCVGTPFLDSDNDGVCDQEDVCPGEDDSIDLNLNGIPDCNEQDCSIGALCDDGDPCTYFDMIVDIKCQCEGTQASDSDNDGVCDPEDVCPGEDDTIDLNTNGVPDCAEVDCSIGALCDDGDPCTYFDMIVDIKCKCAGTESPDSDGDSVCDPEDQCPGFDDLIDLNNNQVPDGCETPGNCLVGDSCDDGDACTGNDVYIDTDCNCAGVLLDSDSDSVCDANDQCPGFDDYVDLDGNGIPDGCDCQVGAPCDDGIGSTINDVIQTNCDCTGINIPTPVAEDATNLDKTNLSFTANWQNMFSASSYYLTVATSPSFDPATVLPNYDDIQITGINTPVIGNGTDSTYYYKLTALLGANMTGWSNIITVKFSTECGSADPPPYDCLATDPAFADVTNMSLRNTLKAGDIVWAADFMVEITEVSGGSGPWSGKAQMSLPLTDKRGKVNLQFSNIYVNAECRIVGEGYMDVTGVGAQIITQEFSDLIQDIVGYLEIVDGALQELEYTIGAINEGLNQLDTIRNYFSEGVQFTDVAGGTDFITQEYPYLPANVVQDVQNAIDCFGANLASGNIEGCNEPFEDAILDLLGALDEMYNASEQVLFFEDSNMDDGLDSMRFEVFSEEYNQFKIAASDYVVSWKSIARGSDEPVNAVMVSKGAFPSNIIFETNTPSPVTTSPTNPLKTLTIQAPAETGTTQIYAIEDQGQGDKKIAGKLNLVTYDKDAIDVVLVPVKGSTNVTIDHPFISDLDLELEIQKVFDQAVQGVNLTVANPLSVSGFDDSMNEFESSPAEKYSQEQENIINALATPDPDTYYIFLVDSYEGTTLGMMPMGSKFGFLYHQNNIGEPTDDEDQYVKTLAHELGHGAFKLRHSFKAWDETSKGLTDNLMDYSTGTTLIKPQWDKVHDPDMLIGVFNGGEEEDELISIDISMFDDYVTTVNNVSYLTFVSNHGAFVTLPRSDIKILTFATGGEFYESSLTLAPTGTLVSFTTSSDRTYNNCLSGNYYENIQNNQCAIANYGFQTINTTRPIIVRHAMVGASHAAHIVELDPLAYSAVPEHNEPGLKPYDFLLKSFFNFTSADSYSVVGAPMGKTVNIPSGSGLYMLSEAFETDLYTEFLNNNHPDGQYDRLTSFYISGAAKLIEKLGNIDPDCGDVSTLKSILDFLMQRTALGGVDMLYSPVEESQVQVFVATLVSQQYFAEAGLVQQEIVNSILRILTPTELVDEYNNLILDIPNNPANVELIINNLLTGPKKLSSCEFDKLAFNSYANLEKVIAKSIEMATLSTSTFYNTASQASPFWIDQNEEWLIVKLMQKILQNDYESFLRFIETQTDDTGARYWYTLVEGVDDSMIDGNGLKFINKIIDMYKYVAVNGVMQSDNNYTSIRDRITALSDQINNIYGPPSAPCIDLAYMQQNPLPIIPYNYQNFLSRINWTNSILCGSSVSATVYCQMYNIESVPEVDITDVEYNEINNTLSVYQQNKLVFFVNGANPQGTYTDLKPFDPFILDKSSNYKDAQKLFSDEDLSIVPAIVLSYLEENASNQTTADIVFTTIDVATLAIPITKVTKIGKVIQYADKASSVLSIAATYNDNNPESQWTPEFRNAINIASLVLGVGDLASGAWTKLKNISNGTDAASDLAGLINKAKASEAAAGANKTQAFDDLLSHLEGQIVGANGINPFDAMTDVERDVLVNIIQSHKSDALSPPLITEARIASVIAKLSNLAIRLASRFPDVQPASIFEDIATLPYAGRLLESDIAAQIDQLTGATNGIPNQKQFFDDLISSNVIGGIGSNLLNLNRDKLIAWEFLTKMDYPKSTEIEALNSFHKMLSNTDYKLICEGFENGTFSRQFIGELNFLEESIYKFYTNVSYYKFNDALIERNLTDDVVELEKLLNMALDKLPSIQATHWRGIGKEEITRLNNLNIGDDITYFNFLSSSEDISIAGTFARKNYEKTGEAAIIIVQSKNGKSIQKYSDAEFEKEILHKSGTKYKLLEVEENKLLNAYEHQFEYYPAIYGKRFTLGEQ